MFSNEPITCSQGRILRVVAGISLFNKEEASFLGGLLEGIGIKGSGNKPPINKGSEVLSRSGKYFWKQ